MKQSYRLMFSNAYLIIFYKHSVKTLNFIFFTHRHTDRQTYKQHFTTNLLTIYYLLSICMCIISWIKLNLSFFSYSIFPVAVISVFHQLLLRLLSFYDHCCNREVLLQMMQQFDIITHFHTSSSAYVQQVLLLSSSL